MTNEGPLPPTLRPRTPLSPYIVVVVAALLALMIFALGSTMREVRARERQPVPAHHAP